MSEIQVIRLGKEASNFPEPDIRRRERNDELAKSNWKPFDTQGIALNFGTFGPTLDQITDEDLIALLEQNVHSRIELSNKYCDEFPSDLQWGYVQFSARKLSHSESGLTNADVLIYVALYTREQE